MTRPDQIVLVSDLHLGAGDEGDPFRRDCDFVAFCYHLASTRPSRPGARRLAVLGDFVELLGVRAAAQPGLAAPSTIAVGRLDTIARAHPAVFAALADVLAAGWDLDILIGNHDVELLRPDVRNRLTELLDPGGSDVGRVRFHPWILHVPGVLYAEHGNQYHDINWFPELLWAAGSRGDTPVRHPVAAQLGRPRTTRGVAVVRDAADRLLGARDPRRRRYRREALPAVAADVDLGVDVLRRIDVLPAVSTAATCLRVAMLAARHGDAPAPYLRRAAAEVDAILRPRGAGCAVYAFGHSHAAECVPLQEAAADRGPVYVNPGTWCRHVRGPLGRAGDEAQATFAVVDDADGARPAVTLRFWRQREEVVVSRIL